VDDENLILGVLAAQAGIVTPAQMVTAASARMLACDNRSRRSPRDHAPATAGAIVCLTVMTEAHRWPTAI